MKNQARNELAYKETEQHRGLTNKIGENNCFLNVTIQALWHLGPFRVHLQQLIAILESHKENPSIHQKKSLLVALCNLFVQYEFADQDMLPPNELRESLSTLSAEYELGKIADATETLETILQNIHEEFESICPSRIKCLAHSTFGGIILEQSRCHLCGASSEPTIRNNYLMYFQSTEMLANMQEIQPPIPLIQMRKTDAEKFSQPRKISSFFNLASFLSSNQSHNSRFSRELAKSSKKDFESLLEKQLLQSKQFGCILKKCLLSVGKRSCPSFGDASGTKSSSGANFEADSKGNENRSNPFQGKDSGSKSHYEKEFKDFKRSTSCLGQASVSLHSLDAPLILALSIGWTESKETKENLLKFFSMISSLIHLEDLFSEGGKLPLSPKHSFRASSKKFSTSKGQKSSVEDCSPAYVFRGMVCYYGKHYVSIFLDSVSSGEESYLLFDDHRVRPIGSWSDAVQFCASSCYQPVLLLYELEKNSIVFTLDKIQQDYSSFSLLDSQHTEGVTTQEAGDRSTTVLTDSSLIREPENDASYLELNYGKTELEEDEKDQENEDNESLQIMSMDTVDDLESKDTAEFILPDIQSGANIRDPLIVTGSKLNLSPENIDDDNTVVHSINANRNILPDDVSALESPSIKSIRRRYPFLQAKFDPDLDIYTNDGRHKSFWSRYYDARYRIDSNGVKVESNYSHRFHRHDQGREFNPHREQVHRINGQFESNYFSHDGKSGGSITSVGFSEFLPENEFMDPYIHLESNYNLNHDFTSEPPIPASPKFLKYQVQSLIEIWGRRPYRYHISLPVLFNEVASVGASFRGTRTFPQVMLGIILDANEREEVFVTGFYKHPVTQKEFPAELSGKINLMDQLLAVNGEFISSLSVSPSTANNNRQDSYFAPDPASKKLLAIHKLISTLHEPFILLEFQSAVCSILWYQCPNCSFTNDIFPDREDSLKKQLMKRIQKRKIKKNDNSNTHSIQNYGIYFRCKFCNVKSLCKDYLPDLSEY